MALCLILAKFLRTPCLTVTLFNYSLAHEKKDIFFLAVIDYVEQIKQTLFSITKEERETIRMKYKGKIPETLTNQFPGRASKETAIGRHKARKQLRTELFPSGKISTHLENSRIITIFICL